MTISRRQFMRTTLAGSVWWWWPLGRFGAAVAKGELNATTTSGRLTFAELRRYAEKLTASPFEDKDSPLPEVLRTLSYDQYQQIEFRREKGLWRGGTVPFEVQFFHRGFLFPQRVAVNILDGEQVTPFVYSSDLFRYGPQVFADSLSGDLGFAGFRLHYPLHRADVYQEFAVFLGASYFRAVGMHQRYGVSARALALDTGLTKTEEFPFFRELWIEKPAREATELSIYALLDSVSATGAYRFVIGPGWETVVTIKASIFTRRGVDKLGIAPLSSMFFHGENKTRFYDDFRPEVHDSDGLLIATASGEWIWRPLTNPGRMRVSLFQETNPRGFGLLQRDRVFDNYQDLEAFYHTRPSAWVEPLGEWGSGTIQLIEFPTDAEYRDNISLFWVPAKPARGKEEWQFEYRLRFAPELPEAPPHGRTLATRIGRGSQFWSRRFVIDFGGAALDRLSPAAPVEALVSASSGKVMSTVVEKTFNGGLRVSFEFNPEGGSPTELRCFLKSGRDILTETWSYHWTPWE